MSADYPHHEPPYSGRSSLPSPDDVSLREFIEAKLDAQALALTKAEAALNARLESMNEIRAQLDRQGSTFMTRDQFEAAHAIVTAQVEDLRAWRTAKDAQIAERDRAILGLRWMLGFLIALVPVAVSIGFAVTH